ncbi:MAG: SDR family NAD(P)-dependent oxidoreductase [Planctomycetota bacterium]|jgi:short-subunit dehydrogenase
MGIDFQGVSALVTGASSGIGREIARQLAPDVGRLVLVARRASRLEELAAELKQARADLRVDIHPCDLNDRAALVKVLEAIDAGGPIDVLINNAGLGDVGLFELADWEKLEGLMTLNMNALTFLCRHYVNSMIERKRGGILNVSSGFGLVFMPGVATYMATKQYVTAFTEALRLEVKGLGISVTQCCPGPVKTEFEGMAGNPTGQSVPGFMEITPQHCARSALKGLGRGRAMVSPGFLPWLITGLGRLSPRWVLRIAFGWMAPALRKRQRALLAGEKT